MPVTCGQGLPKLDTASEKHVVTFYIKLVSDKKRLLTLSLHSCVSKLVISSGTEELEVTKLYLSEVFIPL